MATKTIMNITQGVIDYSYYLIEERRLRLSLKKAITAERFEDAAWLSREHNSTLEVLRLVRTRINHHMSHMKRFDMNYFKEIEFLELITTKSCSELIFLRHQPRWLTKDDYASIGRDDPMIGFINRSELRLAGWKDWTTFLEIRQQRLKDIIDTDNENEELMLIEKLLQGDEFSYHRVKEKEFLFEYYTEITE